VLMDCQNVGQNSRRVTGHWPAAAFYACNLLCIVSVPGLGVPFLIRTGSR